MNLEPLQVQRGAVDLSNFHRFVVPTRALTHQERAVYRELAAEWAVLDATSQATLYAALLDGRLADFLSSVFVRTASMIKAREDEITDPTVKEIARQLHRVVLQEHAGHLAGFQRTAGEQLARQVSRDLTPPPPLEGINRWQQLLGAVNG